MQESIGVVDQNFTAAISVSSMVFLNSFFNIIEGGNTLKIVTVYRDAADALQTDWIIVEVPIGNYSGVTLRDYLNTDNTCNTVTAGVWEWGLSKTTNPFTVSPSDPAAFITNLPSAGTTGELGLMTAALQYTGVYLVVDAETRPLMKLLGFLQINSQGVATNPIDVTVRNEEDTADMHIKAIGQPIYNGGVGFPFNYDGNPYTVVALQPFSFSSPNNADFSSPNALNISWESIYTGTRNSFDNLSSGNTLAVVPIPNSYGDKCVYEPANPFKCIVPNFNVNQFHLIVKNADTGEKVNFRGNHWLITIIIEFYEIDNGYKSATAEEGLGRVVMPSMHSTLIDHNMPFSGTGGYTNSYGRSTQYGENDAAQFKRGRY